jgi:hypothetical protein
VGCVYVRCLLMHLGTLACRRLRQKHGCTQIGFAVCEVHLYVYMCPFLSAFLFVCACLVILVKLMSVKTQESKYHIVGV